MTTPTPHAICAKPGDIDCLIASLRPLSGGYWLATDLKTHVHWTIPADQIRPVIESPSDRICRAFGLVTVCAPDGQPVFLINERDTLDWLEPERVLAVRELGDASCEIRLERLDDLDARLIDQFSVQNRCDNQPFRTIEVERSRFLQVYDDQLPTGSADADAALLMIERTIDARRQLIGPTSGTRDVLEQMARDLDLTLRTYAIRSFIWAAVLQEQIASMRELLAA